MKLSPETLALLKNFASISQSIHIKPGNSLKTVKGSRAVYGEATIPEKFEKEFGIYNLNQFLNSFNLLDDPDLDFSSDKYVVLSEGKRKIKYFYASLSTIPNLPDKQIKMPSQDICFIMEQAFLDKIVKARQIYSLDDLSVVGDGETIQLIVHDKKNDTSNEYSIEVGSTTEKFCMHIKNENLQFYPGSYDVVISRKGISKFINKKIPLTYWVAMEPDSTFE
jgi:hypothetical protein